MIYKITEQTKSVQFNNKRVRHVLTVPFSEQGPKYVSKKVLTKGFHQLWKRYTLQHR